MFIGEVFSDATTIAVLVVFGAVEKGACRVSDVGGVTAVPGTIKLVHDICLFKCCLAWSGGEA